MPGTATRATGHEHEHERNLRQRDANRCTPRQPIVGCKLTKGKRKGIQQNEGVGGQEERGKREGGGRGRATASASRGQHRRGKEGELGVRACPLAEPVSELVHVELSVVVHEARIPACVQWQVECQQQWPHAMISKSTRATRHLCSTAPWPRCPTPCRLAVMQLPRLQGTRANPSLLVSMRVLSKW